jgi:hypothetical protein
MVATSAPVDVRRFIKASSLPPASNLQAFHVSSFYGISARLFLPSCREE